MAHDFQNIHEAEWQDGTTPDNRHWRHIDLSGERLGVRIEEMAPGESSSFHHFHTQEEEHVLILDGAATLILGAEEHSLKDGDHVWFKAGKEDAHHLENRTSEACRFLVFGERNEHDVVMYPENGVMMVKASGRKQLFTYRKYSRPDESETDT